MKKLDKRTGMTFINDDILDKEGLKSFKRAPVRELVLQEKCLNSQSLKSTIDSLKNQDYLSNISLKNQKADQIVFCDKNEQEK
jgi:Ni,Fe-hydrogenase maturation factor